MAFDPKRHVIKVQGGREYLPVSARLVWFRSEHPDWGIVTQATEINLDKQYAIFQASIFNEEGRLIATSTKYVNSKNFPDYIAKAETGAVGRALLLCGYGSQFDPEFDEAPVQAGGGRFTPRQMPAPSNYAPRAALPNRAVPQSAPPPMEADDFDDAPPPRPISRPMPERTAPERPAMERPMNGVNLNGVNGAERPANPATNGAARPTGDALPRPSSAPPPAAGNAPITRVREPERDLPDPGGEGDDDEPFEDDDMMAAPAPRPAAPPAPRSATDAAEAGRAPVEKEKNLLPRCSVEGCANVLTENQNKMSLQKFGRPICLLHQRDAAVTGGANGARRPANSLL